MVNGALSVTMDTHSMERKHMPFVGRLDTSLVKCTEAHSTNSQVTRRGLTTLTALAGNRLLTAVVSTIGYLAGRKVMDPTKQE